MIAKVGDGRAFKGRAKEAARFYAPLIRPGRVRG